MKIPEKIEYEKKDKIPLLVSRVNKEETGMEEVAVFEKASIEEICNKINEILDYLQDIDKGKF